MSDGPATRSNPLPGTAATAAQTADPDAMAGLSGPGRAQTFGLLGSLYLSGFLGAGFFLTGLLAILRDGGASLAQLGVVQALGLLWAAKFLWAPLVDRFGDSRRGHYRSWILIVQPALVVTLLLAAVVVGDPVEDYPRLVVIIAGVLLLSATQDIATDALATQVVRAADRGIANGIQTAGGLLGNLIGSGAVLIVYERSGWVAAMLTLAVVTALPLAQVVKFRETRRPSATGATAGYRQMFGVFHIPRAKVWALAVVPLLWFSVGGATALVSPMLVDVGWSVAAVGVLTTTAAGASIVVALGVGVLVRRLGRRRMLLSACAFFVLALLGLLPLATGHTGPGVAILGVVAMNAGYAAVTTLIYTGNMDLARPETAGTDVTTLASLGFIMGVIGGATALGLAQLLGYVSVMALLVATASTALLVVRTWYVDPVTPTHGRTALR